MPAAESCRAEVQRVSDILQKLFAPEESFAISSNAMRVLVSTVDQDLRDAGKPLDETLGRWEQELPKLRAELLEVGRGHPIRCPNGVQTPFIGVDDMKGVLIKLCPSHDIDY